MKIAAVQMCSTPRVEENLARAAVLIGEAAALGAELIALPEYFCLMGRHDADKLAHAEASGTGPIQTMLADAARRHAVWLVGGTLPMRIDGVADRVRNTLLVFAPDGTLAARYDKIHLFRFDDGERRYDEAATLQAGADPVAFTLHSRAGARWRVGLSVCYDLRFPELYRALSAGATDGGDADSDTDTDKHGGACDLLLVPSAFTHPTGQAHWELLLRARAVENQCVVLAPAQGGLHENGRRTWGHSMAIGPWGEVLAVRDEDGDGVVIAKMDAARIVQVRAQLPALTHRMLG